MVARSAPAATVAATLATQRLGTSPLTTRPRNYTKLRRDAKEDMMAGYAE